MMRVMKNPIFREIENNTRLGSEELQRRSWAHALKCFNKAYKLALNIGDTQTIQSCAFNFGAALVATGHFEKGITMLNLAVPQGPDQDSLSADVYYNIAVAYDNMNQVNSSLDYLKKSLFIYERYNKQEMIYEVSVKVAKLYEAQSIFHEAKLYYQKAQEVCQHLGLFEEKLTCKIKVINCAIILGDFSLAGLLKDCVEETVRIENKQTKMNILNEAGLSLMYSKQYTLALKCFCHSLELITPDCADYNFQKAVYLQNKGSAYTALTNFLDAIPVYEEAAKLFIQAKTPNRQAQGQCFLNLAFCFTELNRLDKSKEFYLHALQAARDSGDCSTEWQALEGLGAVEFHFKNMDASVAHFQAALGLSANNSLAQDRLLRKLTAAIQIQLKLASQKSGSGSGSFGPDEKDSKTASVNKARSRLKQALSYSGNRSTGQSVKAENESVTESVIEPEIRKKTEHGSKHKEKSKKHSHRSRSKKKDKEHKRWHDQNQNQFDDRPGLLRMTTGDSDLMQYSMYRPLNSDAEYYEKNKKRGIASSENKTPVQPKSSLEQLVRSDDNAAMDFYLGPSSKGPSSSITVRPNVCPDRLSEKDEGSSSSSSSSSVSNDEKGAVHNQYRQVLADVSTTDGIVKAEKSQPLKSQPPKDQSSARSASDNENNLKQLPGHSRNTEEAANRLDELAKKYVHESMQDAMQDIKKQPVKGNNLARPVSGKRSAKTSGSTSYSSDSDSDSTFSSTSSGSSYSGTTTDSEETPKATQRSEGLNSTYLKPNAVRAVDPNAEENVYDTIGPGTLNQSSNSQPEVPPHPHPQWSADRRKMSRKDLSGNKNSNGTALSLDDRKNSDL